MTSLRAFRYFVRRQIEVKSAFFRDYITYPEASRLLWLYHGLDKTDVRSDAGIKHSVDTAMRLARGE